MGPPSLSDQALTGLERPSAGPSRLHGRRTRMDSGLLERVHRPKAG